MAKIAKNGQNWLKLAQNRAKNGQKMAENWLKLAKNPVRKG